MKTIWLLTSEFNDYDQYGEYFVATFVGKPNLGQLAPHLDGYDAPEHVLAGGGRRDDEFHWFHLVEHELEEDND